MTLRPGDFVKTKLFRAIANISHSYEVMYDMMTLMTSKIAK